MQRITAMSRHRDHLPGIAASLHFYGMREAAPIPLRDGGPLCCDHLIGREQLVKAVKQRAQAEFDHKDLAAPGKPATGPCASRWGWRSLSSP